MEFTADSTPDAHTLFDNTEDKSVKPAVSSDEETSCEAASLRKSESLVDFVLPTIPVVIDNLAMETASVAVETMETEESTDVFRLVALTDDNTLVSFDSDNPGASEFTHVTGVNGILLGIDTRPADGSIYGISTANNIYTIDPESGEATYVSTLDTPFEGGTISGFDFNPVADRLRLVGDNDQDFRINVDTGEVTVDGTLAFAEGDVNAGVNPNVTAAAYTNSFDGTETTQLYDIDTLLNALVLQDPPNDGTLVTVGNLGVDFDTLGGFEIIASVEGENTAFAVSDRILYSVDIYTGTAYSLGHIGVNDSFNLPLNLLKLRTFKRVQFQHSVFQSLYVNTTSQSKMIHFMLQRQTL